MKNRYLWYLFLIEIILLYSCQNNPQQSVFENKQKYEVAVGDTIDIYTSYSGTDSFTVPAEEIVLKRIAFIGKTIVKETPGCSGCEVVTAYRYQSILKGNDTIRFERYSAMDDSLLNVIEYLIVIK